MAVELIADRRTDEVGAVGIEAFLHHQVDMVEIDIAQVDRDLLAVTHLGPEVMNIAGHLDAILTPSMWMVNGRLRAHDKVPSLLISYLGPIWLRWAPRSPRRQFAR